MNMITDKQVGYISYRIKEIRHQVPEVRAWFPDIPDRGANMYLVKLEDDLHTLNTARAHNVIVLLMSDTLYLEGVRMLREYLEEIN